MLSIGKLVCSVHDLSIFSRPWGLGCLRSHGLQFHTATKHEIMRITTHLSSTLNQVPCAFFKLTVPTYIFEMYTITLLKSRNKILSLYHSYIMFSEAETK